MDFRIDELFGEMWMKLPGYGGNFFVSDLGRVYSLKDKDCLNQFELSNGKMAVDIKWKGNVFTYAVDKLVYDIFFSFPMTYINKRLVDIDHLDGNLRNNRASNLKGVYDLGSYDVSDEGTKKKDKADSKKTALDFIEGISKRVKTDSTTDEFVESQQAKVAKTILNDAKR